VRTLTLPRGQNDKGRDHALFCSRNSQTTGAGFGDPPEDEHGVYIIPSGSNPALTETIDAIWGEDNGVAAVDELLAQLQQLAEDDLGVAAVHEVWEGITDYER
jgi:hypothetical protein